MDRSIDLSPGAHKSNPTEVCPIISADPKPCYLTTVAQLIAFCVVYDVCSLFDGWIDRFHVYKVETIGDSYMVASGVPYTIPDHAGEMARLALELRNSVEDFKIPHLDEALHLRVGLHSGDVQLDQFLAISNCVLIIPFLRCYTLLNKIISFQHSVIYSFIKETYKKSL